MFKLLDAFESVLKKVKQTKGHEIDFERISITDRINQLSDILRSRPTIAFDELFSGDRTRADIIVTFLALLEMTRLKMTRITQDSPYAPIHIELAVREDGDVPALPEGGAEASFAPAGEDAEPSPARPEHAGEAAAAEGVDVEKN